MKQIYRVLLVTTLSLIGIVEAMEHVAHKDIIVSVAHGKTVGISRVAWNTFTELCNGSVKELLGNETSAAALPHLSKEELEVVIKHIDVLSQDAWQPKVKLFYNLLKEKKTLEYFAFLKAADYLGIECLLQLLGSILQVSFDFLNEQWPQDVVEKWSDFNEDYTKFSEMEDAREVASLSNLFDDEVMEAGETFEQEFLQGLVGLEFMFQSRHEAAQCIVLYAAEKGYVEFVKVLIEKGVSILTPDRYGRTALMVATQRGHRETIETLLQACVDLKLEEGAIAQYVNLPDYQGWTALAFAVAGMHVRIIKSLLEHGACMHAKAPFAGGRALALQNGEFVSIKAPMRGCKTVLDMAGAAVGKK